MAKASKLPSTRRQLLTSWRNSGRGLTLKEFARSEQGGEAGATWLKNKRANTKGALKKIGHTRTRVKSGGKVQQKA